MAKRKTSLGCLFWIALILLVLVVFFFNRERIIHVMEETGFSDYISTDIEKKPEVNRKNIDEPEQTEEPSARQEESSEEEDSRRTDIEETDKIEIEEEQDESEVLEIRIEDEEEKEEAEEDKEKPKIEQKLRKSTVYFVSVDDSGDISLKQIVRPVYYTDSPLTATLETLLEGLSPEELNQGLLNLIPENTQINSIRIENSTAYIDFSEDLRFNPFGTEGIKAALRQIVYTATEFSTVDKVQILINGNRISYLSSEGINIEDPLSRRDISG